MAEAPLPVKVVKKIRLKQVAFAPSVGRNLTEGSGVGNAALVAELGSGLRRWTVAEDANGALGFLLDAAGGVKPSSSERLAVRVFDDGRVALRDNQTTFIYDADLKTQLGQFIGDFGRLVAVLGTDMLAYTTLVDWGIYKIDLYRATDHTAVTNNNGLTTTVESGAVSIAAHPKADLGSEVKKRDGLFVVGDWGGKTLDFYSSLTGLKNVKRVRLEAPMLSKNGLAAVGEVIVVPDISSIYVYNWAGQVVYVQVLCGEQVDGVGRLSGRLLIMSRRTLETRGSALTLYDVEEETDKIKQ